MKIDFNWLVFGLFQEEWDHPERAIRWHGPLGRTGSNQQVIIYQLGDRAIVMRFDCPYWIRIEGQGWGMIVSMLHGGTYMRAMRGDRTRAETDLFLLRMVLPKYKGQPIK